MVVGAIPVTVILGAHPVDLPMHTVAIVSMAH